MKNAKKSIIFKIFIFFAAGQFFLPGVFAQDAAIGRITYAGGRVDILKQGSMLAVPLREGDEVSLGDVVRTKSNSKAEVKFNDGSAVRLAQNSRVEISDYRLDKNNTRVTASVKLDRGKIRAIIKKTAGSAEFNILTPNAEGKVRGSDIFAFYQAGSSGVLVAEGNLAMKSLLVPENALTVTAGSSAIINVQGAASGPRPYMALERKLYEHDTSVPYSAPKKGEAVVIKGAFVKISGSVKITTPGARAPHDAKYNEVIGDGDRIETGDNGFCEVKFDNGCALALKPDTQVTITKLVIDPRTREYQNLFESSKGKIKARIENLKGKSTFEIKTPTAICGARGTFMYLDITPSMTKAFFEGGNGYINNLISGAQTDIGMGDNGSSDDQGNNSDPAPTPDEERDNWTQGWETGDGTSGYSPGPSNDDMTGLGDGSGTGGTGDTGGGTGGGSTDDNGGTDLYIPPENSMQPPSTTPVMMSLTGTFGIGREEYAFGYYDHENEMINFDSGYITNGSIYGEGNFWAGAPVLFAALANYSNPDGRNFWRIDDLSGTASDGTAYAGAAGGIIDEVDIFGIMYAIYIRPTADGYRLGYFRSAGMAGGLSPEIFTLTGYIESYLDIATSVSPDMLSGLVSDTPLYFGGNVGGDISGMISGESQEFIGLGLGIWKLSCGGNYNIETPPQGGWKAVAGGEEEDLDATKYWITAIDGTRWQEDKFAATIQGTSITRGNSGGIENSYLGIIYGDLIGIYDDGLWEALGAGVYNETPLAFGGDTTHEEGVDYALFGGTESLWPGSPQATFIGNYFTGSSSSLWRFHVLGEDNFGTAIYGMAGGTKLQNTLKGLLYAIYIRPDPENPGQYLAGYFESADITGNIYPQLGTAGMFEAYGALVAHKMSQTAVSPDDLKLYMQNDTWNDRSAPVYRDEFSGNIGGDIDNSTFSGESIAISYSYTDQPWSIWRTESYGTYQTQPEGPWHAVFGGSDSEYGDKGYFLGNIDGPAWSGNEFSGNITGIEIWYSPSHFEISTMGFLTGRSIGTYADGSWEMMNIGLTEELPLQFGGEIMLTDKGFGYYDYNGTKHMEDYDGSLSVLFGGTESLWTATAADPAQVTLIGEYSNPDPANYTLWGHNWVGGETADGAKYLGFLCGTNINNSLKAMSALLYVRPDPANPGSYLAGYLRSNDISGSLYPDIGMLHAAGNYTFNLDVATAVLPSQVFKNSAFIKETGNSNDFGIVGGDISGIIENAGFKLVEPDGTSQPWSIWGNGCGGTFTTAPANPDDWHAFVGGKSTDNETGDITGYWLGDINGNSWSPDGSLSGTINFTGIDRFGDHPGYDYLTTSEGGILGFYETDPNTWQALSVGVTTETPLAFGGEISPAIGGFGNYDTEVRDVELNFGSLSLIFGGTESLWTASPAPVTFVGEFSNPDGYKLWGHEWVSGQTDDGARFLGAIGGTKIDSSLRAISTMLYIRPDPANPGSYLAGYLKSTDISGNFYPDIGMLYATGHYTHYLDVPTNVLPSQLYAGSPYILDQHNAEDYSTIGGDISGNFSVTSTKLVEPSGNEADWGISRIGAGGTFSGTPSNNWHAVTGGKNTNETTGALEGYWLGDINGNNWSANSLSASVAGVWIDRFFISGPTDEDYFGTFQGDLLGFYETNPNAWQALGAGINPPGTPLTFGGESLTAQGSRFGYYNSEAGGVETPSGSLSYLFGGTSSLWAGSAQMTVIGEYSNPDNDSLWANGANIVATTSDGGRLLGGFGGISLNNLLKGGSYLFYIRPDPANPGSYLAGCLRSTDISGNFYPEIGMFKAQGTLSLGGFEYPTNVLPANLEDGLDLDYTNTSRGLISGLNLSGTAESSSANISDQLWGLFNGSSGGAYSTLPTANWQAHMGGNSIYEDLLIGEIDHPIVSYWIGTLSGGAWQDGWFSTTANIAFLNERYIGHSFGTGIGTYNTSDNTWQALNGGAYILDTPLSSSGRFVAQGWNLEPGSGFDFAGLIGLIGPIWTGETGPDFVSMGEFTPPTNERFAWYGKKEWYYPEGPLAGRDGFVSRYLNYGASPGDPDPYVYTTYDDASGAGSFYGLSAGVGGDGKLKGKIISLCITPSGDAGTLFGNIDGDYYADIKIYSLGGELAYNLRAQDIGILPEELRNNISWDTLSGFDDHGGFSAGGDVYANGGEGTMLNITGQDWGIWNLVMSGTYTGPVSDIWNIYDLTGMTISHDSDYAAGSWLGGIDGTRWNPTDGIEGTLDAIWIALHKDGTLSGREITGEAVGNYIEVSVDHGTWQAGAVGEWQEIASLMDTTSPANLAAFTERITASEQYTSIPITEAMSGAGSFAAGGAISSVTMNANFFTMAGGGDGIWASIINGLWSGQTGNSWTVDLTNANITATLTGTAWENGRWQANVSGVVNDIPGISSFTGNAAGTYTGDTSGSFTGGGTGTFTQGPAE